MTTLWATILILGVLITIHEYGHFIAARSVGIRVERFSIGIPPRFLTLTSIENGWLLRLFFIKKSNGKFSWQPIYEKMISKPHRPGSSTEYVLALLPLGGYVKMAGIIDESMDAEIKYEDDEFMSKPLWAKLWVMSAGVIMNTILAFAIFAAIGYTQGMPEVSDNPIVAELQPGMPALAAGIQPGDQIVSINGISIQTWKDLTSIIHAQPNKEITLIVLRKNVEINLSLTTSFFTSPSEAGIDTLGAIGIIPEILYTDISIGEAIKSGWRGTVGSFGMIIMSLKMLGSGSASMSDFGGPIMIAQLAGQTAEAGWVPFLTFMAMISVNLAFINILPIPGLDGGHIMIHLVEGIIRRPLSMKARIFIQQIGMVFLLMLMITIIFNDISRLFN
ncbi:MAG: RIP metalloprotease RseP [Candidatus Marinimicrobia bacterium]|jgi:regulator of sigma E protease|nr:RIP metalloprotease RseP [Candidatus Neomarinimicrobiota bacterium]MBT3839020.1 RIP metalloprotease RseP [Candidatus Neomarinimicrobiota bacterium]MBT3999305.1 RIP metalloprotease RseP [Candidatus Neomarinimicrobiota bacterium]MBT4282743.1 RIP metalloprotease RseP [Candidatus Neomarinimicrobiota bacterium]MBT4578307.1 RIP metalloprotease RseP [Candidatus Neomarinimicrobiota bacterium]